MEPLWLWVALSLVVAATLLMLALLIRRRAGGAELDAALRDPARQMEFVSSAKFVARPLLIGAEAEAFRVIEAELLRNWTTLRLFAQPTLGEFLAVEGRDEAARRSINAKRVDMLITDTAFVPRVAIEYQGGGHYRGDARQRDAVKRMALESAGVALVEIPARSDSATIRRLVLEALRSGQHQG